jgi:exopolysaccharide biosynthesis polyprenyl glycosylphosphotransferase
MILGNIAIGELQGPHMHISTVATDKDVRAPRLVPSAAQLLSAHSLRRTFGVAALLAIDSAALVVAVLLVTLVSWPGSSLLWWGLSWWEVAVAVAVFVTVAALSGLYGRRRARHGIRKVASAWAIAFVITLVLMLVIDPRGIGARYTIAWLTAGVLNAACRSGFDALTRALLGPNGDAPPAVLMGTRASCKSALETLRSASGINVVALLTQDYAAARKADAYGLPPELGDARHLRTALLTTGATEVIIADPAELNGRLQVVMETCRESGVAIKVISPALQPYADSVTFIPGLDCPLFVVHPEPASAASYLAKQVFDRVCAAVLLVVLSPVLLAITAAIKLTSRGPVLFVEERVGVGQRPFRCFKFRTMVRDARKSQDALEKLNEADGVLFKLRDDPRVTPVGRILRRLSLDELPQLANVLRGDMSFVGPRPLPLRDCGRMEDSHRRRHVLKPGMTGLWQISGRSQLTFDDMVRLDLQYIENWSLRADAYILWRTVGAVVRSRGAY